MSAAVDSAGEKAALYVLARELWVVIDRLRTLEAILDQQGIPVSAAVEAYSPSAEEQSTRDAECRRMVTALVRELSGLPDEILVPPAGHR
jgi:hypothetical protein